MWPTCLSAPNQFLQQLFSIQGSRSSLYRTCWGVIAQFYQAQKVAQSPTQAAPQGQLLKASGEIVPVVQGLKSNDFILMVNVCERGFPQFESIKSWIY